MKFVKLLITIFFLITSYWVTYLVFSRNFAHAGMQFSADNWNENTFMILLTSTSLSAVGVFFLGILSMFTHFIFVKLIFADEIKQAAYFYVKNRKKESPDLIQYRQDRLNEQIKQLPWYKRLLYHTQQYFNN